MPFPPVHPVLDAALIARDYLEPTAVQSAVLQPEALGRDLLVSARTGSGKTVAFGLAAAATLLPDGALPTDGKPIALVIAPTRELALQVREELSWLYAGARIASCVGGMSIFQEERALRGGCHIVVGTPGRLGDHLRRGNLDLVALRVVVLDEADEMLDLGFREELEVILDATPATRRTMMFSATIPHDIASLARKYQRDALRIDTIDRSVPHDDIEYRAMLVAGHETEGALVNILRWYDAPGALVFCATREATRRLHGALLERGFAAVMLSGELSQHERTAALDALRSGRARVGVCTDVAARGIDLPSLDLVIHADLPTNPETLLHRSGRTGRAGRKGVCVLMVAQSKRRRGEQVIQAARVRAAWSNAPGPTEIALRDRERFLTDPMFGPAEGDEREEALALLEAHDPVVVAAALLRLARRRLPGTVEIGQPYQADAPREPARTPYAARETSTRPAAQGGFVPFRLAVGRNKRADPKWILPLICRIGGLNKGDIGAIRIFPVETMVEIRAEVADAFAVAAANLPPHEPKISRADVMPVEAAPPRPMRPKNKRRS